MFHSPQSDWMTASQIGEYFFCQRSWSLSRHGTSATSEQEVKRAEENPYHERHGVALESGLSLGQWGVWFLFFGLLLLLLGILAKR